MSTEALLAEIEEINLAYLTLVQRLLEEEGGAACVRLKLDDAMAAVLVSLSSGAMRQLARTNQFIFRLALEDADQLRDLLDRLRA